MMKENLGVILLAGGLSERLGYDKAFYKWEGISLLLFQLRRLEAMGCTEVLLSLGVDKKRSEQLVTRLQSAGFAVDDRNGNKERMQVMTVMDKIERRGPLGGLLSCLQEGHSEAYLVAPVDAPLVPFSTIASWWHKQQALAIIPIVRGRREPLGAIYKKEALEPLEAYLESGKSSIHGFLDSIEVEYLEVEYGNWGSLNNASDANWLRAIHACKDGEVPIVSVVSSERKSGKTSVIKRLVELLSQRDISVGVVKSDGHGFIMDQQGTDTSVFMDAGATEVAIVGPGETAIRKKRNGKDSLFDVARCMQVDLIFVETRSQGRFPIIEIVHEASPPSLYEDRDVVARCFMEDEKKIHTCCEWLIGMVKR